MSLPAQLKAQLVECELHVDLLCDALAEAEAWLPVTVSMLTNIDKNQRRILDQLAYRFAKLQDTLGQKVLPAILMIAQEPIDPDATFAEKLNWLERMGVIPSADEWRQLRLARNAIAHEYPDEPDVRVSQLNLFVAAVSRLCQVFSGINAYLVQHFPD